MGRIVYTHEDRLYALIPDEIRVIYTLGRDGPKPAWQLCSLSPGVLNQLEVRGVVQRRLPPKSTGKEGRVADTSDADAVEVARKKMIFSLTADIGRDLYVRIHNLANESVRPAQPLRAHS